VCDLETSRIGAPHTHTHTHTHTHIYIYMYDINSLRVNDLINTGISELSYLVKYYFLFFKYIFLTAHLRIILVVDQLDAQFLL